MPTEHRMINLKWPLWGFILFLSIPAILWTYNGINEAYWNAKLIKLDKEAEGLERPPYPGELGKQIFERKSPGKRGFIHDGRLFHF